MLKDRKVLFSNFCIVITISIVMLTYTLVNPKLDVINSKNMFLCTLILGACFVHDMRRGSTLLVTTAIVIFSAILNYSHKVHPFSKDQLLLHSLLGLGIYICSNLVSALFGIILHQSKVTQYKSQEALYLQKWVL